MKHVDERIRERALPAAADRAFAALRDREALAAFVREKAPGQGSADEVALALAPGDDPPRLLVSRQGRGVTCLASGMATPSAVVPYGEVQAFVDEQQRLLRARMVIAQDEQRLENQRPLTRDRKSVV